MRGQRVNSFRFLILVAGLIVPVTQSWANSDEDIKAACGSLMGESASLLSQADLQSSIASERHNLSALLKTGPESLIHQHPWMIMNSAQRALHMIYREGVKEVPDRKVGFGTRKRYAFFSDAVELTDGQFVVGHIDGISKIVTFIEATADGQPGRDHVPTLMGPPGTGKSHILTLFRKALKNGTSKVSEYYSYSFEWVNLSAIEALKGRLPSVATRAESPEAFSDPVNDSPIAILPAEIQQKVLAAHSQRVQDLVGRDPAPKTELNPKSEFIRSAILAHYRAELGRGLTIGEELEYLSRHVKIKRVVLGSQSTAPYLANQGKEPNLANLFGSNNPLVKATFGTEDPFAVQYGVFARANTGIVFLDEIMKNEPSLIGQFLNLFSSHVVEVAPGVNVPIDAFFIAASNLKERDDLRAKDPQNPLLSRNLDISWPYVFYPDEVGRVLAMEIQHLKARRLGTSASGETEPYTDIQGKQVFMLYPEVRPFEAVVTPHGRYAIKVGAAASREIFISPHALEFMANVVTLTRLNFDREKVNHGERYPLVKSNDAIFSNPLVRLRVLLGEKTVTEAQLEELNSVSVASGEGNFGIDHRDVERWFTEAMAKSQSSANGNTVTPILLYEVLKREVNENKIFAGNKQAQDRLILFAQMVFQEFVVPGMTEDLNMAFARSEGREVLDTIYYEIQQELAALSVDPNAQVYIAQPSNEKRRIDQERLKKVRKIYERKQGRPLNAQELGTWQLFNSRQADPARPGRHHPGLQSAITAYHTDLVLQKERTTIKRLLDIADNPEADAKAPERERANELMRILQEELGYNLYAAKSAIEVLASLEANRSPSPQGQ
jgi:predicted Ser/Thr protein kinase